MSGSSSETHPLLSTRSLSKSAKKCGCFAVEPVVIIYFVAFHATGPLMQQLVYARIGDALKEELYGNVSNTSSIQQNASSACTEDFRQQQNQQAKASQMQMIFTVCAVVPALFSTLLLGAYSDVAGRKLAIAAPLVGEMLRIATCIIVATTSVPIMLLALGLFLEGLSGSAAGFMMGAYAYMADTADPKHRTLRLVIVEFCMGVGNTGAQVAVGYVIAEFGWLGPLIGVLVMHILSFIYVLCCLPETITYHPPPGKAGNNFISVRHYLRTAELYVKDKSHGRRVVLQLCLAVIALIIMIDITGTEILTLYLLNWPFCWNSIDIGYYNALAYAARYMGAIVLVWTLRKYLSESALMIIGIISNIGFDIVLAVAMVLWVVYLAPVVGLAMPLVVSMARAIASHNVEAHEQGALFGSQAWVSMLSGLFGGLIFNAVYSSTLYSLHGIIYIIAACLLLLPLSLAAFLMVYIRRRTIRTAGIAERKSKRKATVRSISGPAISPGPFTPLTVDLSDRDDDVFS